MINHMLQKPKPNWKTQHMLKLKLNELNTRVKPFVTFVVEQELATNQLGFRFEQQQLHSCITSASSRIGQWDQWGQKEDFTSFPTICGSPKTEQRAERYGRSKSAVRNSCGSNTCDFATLSRTLGEELTCETSGVRKTHQRAFQRYQPRPNWSSEQGETASPR